METRERTRGDIETRARTAESGERDQMRDIATGSAVPLAKAQVYSGEYRDAGPGEA